MAKRTYEWLLPFLFTGGLILARYLFPSKMTFITEVALYTLYVMGNNILFGYMGYVSFGQPVYLSMGAYSAAIYLAYLGKESACSDSRGHPHGSPRGGVDGSRVDPLRAVTLPW
jgi:ABC-type branched-chain amino acid transport system, permease component